MICDQFILHTPMFRHVEHSTPQNIFSQVEHQTIDNSNMRTLAERLIEARNDLDLTKADLRRRAGLKSASTLTELETGSRTKSPQLPQIAHALGVNIMWLLEERGPKKPVGRPGDEALTEAIQLLALFNAATLDGRRLIMATAREVDKELQQPTRQVINN